VFGWCAQGDHDELITSSTPDDVAGFEAMLRLGGNTAQ